ncbi:MAG TPA: hypothetical protein VK489_05140 [Ferruginibacter sp.]|nr:hypothetical protein [Ferruginibacter sp.]
MAKENEALLLKDIRGHIGKQIVVKQYADKTVVTKFPSMPKHKATELKAVYEGRFKEAIKYAKDILMDKNLKASYQAKLPPGKRVYNAAISEYLHQENGTCKSAPEVPTA